MKKRILLFFTALLLLALTYVLGWSSLLTISTINIQTTDPKNVALIEAQLTSAGVGIEVGSPIARLNPRAIERALKEQTWIGEVRIERDWFSGTVDLFVKEEIPRFVVQQSGLGGVNVGGRFMARNGTLFTLPGDLAAEYLDLPELELRTQSAQSRIDAATVFDLTNERFPISKVIVTQISTFITESEAPIFRRGEENPIRLQKIRIAWGDLEEMDAKMTVIDELLTLKSNRGISEIDVSNPRLPIVSKNQ